MFSEIQHSLFYFNQNFKIAIDISISNHRIGLSHHYLRTNWNIKLKKIGIIPESNLNHNTDVETDIYLKVIPYSAIV